MWGGARAQCGRIRLHAHELVNQLQFGSQPPVYVAGYKMNDVLTLTRSLSRYYTNYTRLNVGKKSKKDSNLIITEVRGDTGRGGRGGRDEGLSGKERKKEEERRQAGNDLGQRGRG